MTYPNGDWLSDLGADTWERQQLAEVLDEIEAGDYGDELPYGEPGDDYGDLGPWDDSADMLRAANRAVGRAHAADAQRQAEDAEDQAAALLRPSSEQRLARGIARVSSGTYTPPGYFRAARDTGGRFSAICGDADDMGGCSARYHAADCAAVGISSAASGSAEDAEAWNRVVGGHVSAADVTAAEQVTGLANSGPGWDDLLEPPPDSGSYPELLADVRHVLGLSEQQPRRIPERDTKWLREALGI